jgi:hypothetical protein
MDEIPKAELDAIRRLSDGQLRKLIEQISMYSWPKAQETLKLLAKEKSNA